MSIVRVLVNGAKGRMGSASVSALEGHPDFEVCAALDRDDSLSEGLASSKPDVALDWTLASVGFENAKTILEYGVSPVIGTSGFKKSHVDELTQLAASKNVGGIIVPNFAIGAVLMMKFAKEAGKYFEYAEVVELHHEKKEEFPSGTAIRTAEMIAEGNEEGGLGGVRSVSEGRGVLHSGVPVHSVRMPGYLAHQEVLFGGVGQTLTIRHDSMSTDSFMPGVLHACQHASQLDHLVCGLEHIL